MNTNGATSVSIIGGGSATVVDEQTTSATGGASAGSPIGTSTLATVVLDGIGAGISTLTSGVLANVSVLEQLQVGSEQRHDRIAGGADPDARADAATVNSLGVTTSGTAITDAKATSITITTSDRRHGGQFLRTVGGRADVPDVHQHRPGHPAGGDGGSDHLG